jgi:hypothetical protein
MFILVVLLPQFTLHQFGDAMCSVRNCIILWLILLKGSLSRPFTEW